METQETQVSNLEGQIKELDDEIEFQQGQIKQLKATIKDKDRELAKVSHKESKHTYS